MGWRHLLPVLNTWCTSLLSKCKRVLSASLFNCTQNPFAFTRSSCKPIFSDTKHWKWSKYTLWIPLSFFCCILVVIHFVIYFTFEYIWSRLLHSSKALFEYTVKVFDSLHDQIHHFVSSINCWILSFQNGCLFKKNPNLSILKMQLQVNHIFIMIKKVRFYPKSFTNKGLYSMVLRADVTGSM